MFLGLHIFASSVRMCGAESWAALMTILKHPVLRCGEFLVFAAFVFHALNGVRLVLIELGLVVGKAEEPVYPYETSLNRQKPLALIVMILCIILILAGAYDAFWKSH